MVRIKLGTESNTIFLKSPDVIKDIDHSTMIGNIDSIADKLYVEFYDVLNEDGFNAKFASRTDMNNFKMLGHAIIDAKDVPFDAVNNAV